MQDNNGISCNQRSIYFHRNIVMNSFVTMDIQLKTSVWHLYEFYQHNVIFLTLNTQINYWIGNFLNYTSQKKDLVLFKPPSTCTSYLVSIEGIREE